jgi:hypothetical protein
VRLDLKERLASLSRWFGGAQTARAKPLIIDYVPGVEAEQSPALPPIVPPVIPTNIPDRIALSRAFDSAHPVRSREELLGRQKELEDLLAATLDFGQHAIVHGARGSGKTSLVRIFGDHADQNGAVVIYFACEPAASFGDLVLPYLQALPIAAIRSGQRDTAMRAIAVLENNITPRAVVELLTEYVGEPVIFIFDEFDRVTDADVKSDIAACMKLLSDALATVTFMLVGIARDVSDVVNAHPSLRRHMRTVALGRIESDSVDALISKGASLAALGFSDSARTLIARVSCGSPFHVRLFAHHAAMNAVRNEQVEVSETHVRAGLRTALNQWASMNIADAATFVRLVESGQRLDLLEHVAQQAAVHDRVASNAKADQASLDLLAGAVGPELGDETVSVFKDSVAPQFLIALIALAESSIKVTNQEAAHAVAF